MSIDGLIDQVSTIVERYVDEEMTEVFACRDIGLDPRCGMVYINEECIAVDKSRRGTVDYYGGLEYVRKDCVYEMGGYVFYLAEDDRILEHIDRYYNPREEDDA